ncbi:hypothetical protein K488DRAFT_82374 [Vararia minispora EC-137]|uniref:Uncharacterized protein n=1 Tax=Vararia minispora EC-137 TaxID=1314806 RepID=A0ACB8QWN6_9AGAM|nr:hypothetical protein K488DRAFT_82374 [Vararia minispora EC-137]
MHRAEIELEVNTADDSLVAVPGEQLPRRAGVPACSAVAASQPHGTVPVRGARPVCAVNLVYGELVRALADAPSSLKVSIRIHITGGSVERYSVSQGSPDYGSSRPTFDGSAKTTAPDDSFDRTRITPRTEELSSTDAVCAALVALGPAGASPLISPSVEMFSFRVDGIGRGDSIGLSNVV